MGWKEKPHRKAQKKAIKVKQDDMNDFQREILRMQGLIICNACDMTYSLYQPKCPHCEAPNQTHYPAKA